MNCNTCRYELSQCLDGRLPSGRRALVMQHTTTCEPCAEFWEEMQAAQRLVLRLPREQVGGGFREQLWERIRAGEGTPEAVFREPVPMLVKARYTLTGAAAAAAVLLFGLWLHNDSSADPTHRSQEDLAIASNKIASNKAASDPTIANQAPPTLVADRANAEFDRDPLPMLNSLARPLTASLVAVETARQIESRYASVDFNLRQLGTQRRQAKDNDSTQLIVERILEDAGELQVFAEVLLEMRDNDRVSFPDPDIGADLRLVTTTLAPIRLRHQNLDTVQQFVEPTLQQSRRLGRMSRYIRVTPTLDPYEEASILIQMSAMRPDVFPKLFIVFGQGSPSSEHFGLFRQGRMFLFEDACGPSFVAPRSVVESSGRLR